MKRRWLRYGGETILMLLAAARIAAPSIKKQRQSSLFGAAAIAAFLTVIPVWLLICRIRTDLLRKRLRKVEEEERNAGPCH